MKTMSYSEKLKDPRWQRRRLEVMERDGFCCSKCLSDKYTLNVHHKKYLDGKEPWDYPLHYLVTLCEHCHTLEHTTAINSALSLLFERGFPELAILRALTPAAVDFARDCHPELFKYINLQNLLRLHSDNIKKDTTPFKFKLPTIEDSKKNG